LQALKPRSNLISTIVRIVLGYVQCASPVSNTSRYVRDRTWLHTELASWLCRVLAGLSVFRCFLHVRFPPIFDSWLAFMEMVSPDVFRLVSFQCVMSDGVSYHAELIATLVLPIVSVLVLLAVALSVVRCTPIWAQVHDARSLLRVIISWPQVWDLGLWAFLVVYPMLARQTLSIFDCIDYADHSLLRAETDVRCYTSDWLPWAFAAFVGAFVYCFGTPVGIIRAASKSEIGSSTSQRLVQVLMQTYRPRHAYWEGVDLLRKFVLTGVITIVQPESRIQLWFGAVVCLFFLLLHVRLRPFKSSLCDYIQATALLQLLFTYLSAPLFFVDVSQPEALRGENRYLGLTLVCGNSLAFLLVCASGIRGMQRVHQDLNQVALTWEDGITPVALYPPLHPTGWHCFISHGTRRTIELGT
jgi:hypothetical protein